MSSLVRSILLRLLPFRECFKSALPRAVRTSVAGFSPITISAAVLQERLLTVLVRRSDVERVSASVISDRKGLL